MIFNPLMSWSRWVDKIHQFYHPLACGVRSSYIPSPGWEERMAISVFSHSLSLQQAGWWGKDYRLEIMNSAHMISGIDWTCWFQGLQGRKKLISVNNCAPIMLQTIFHPFQCWQWNPTWTLQKSKNLEGDNDAEISHGLGGTKSTRMAAGFTVRNSDRNCNDLFFFH